MDRAKFTSKALGQLVKISHPTRGSDWAFIPAPIPASLVFDADLWPLLVEAREALGTLNGIGQTLPHPNLLLRPLQNREALASSNIEGTFATPEQLLLYGLDPHEPRHADEQTAEWQEVFNYGIALQRGVELLTHLPVCNRLIKEVHEVLMRGVRGRTKDPGKFRTGQVQLGSSGRFIPPPPQMVEGLMGNLENYINDDRVPLDKLVRTYVVHYQFETIHPFSDGNGRVGRVLLALMIQKWFGHSHPWLYMSSYFDRFKDEYMDNLFNVSAKGAWKEWIEFCLRGTVMQAKDSIRRCREFNRLYAEFHNRVKPTSRTHEIIEDLFESPVVNIASLSKTLGVGYNTAKSDIDRFVDAGILREISNYRPKSFFSHEIMDVAYREDESPATEARDDSTVPTDEHPVTLSDTPSAPEVYVPPDLF